MSDGASRQAAVEVERIKTDVAIEFAPRIAAARGLGLLLVRYRRWQEVRKRIEALSGNSAHINWLRRY